MSPSRFCTLVVGLALVGCPGSASSGGNALGQSRGTPSNTLSPPGEGRAVASAVRPESVAETLQIEDTPEGRARLAQWCRDEGVEPALRLAALRRLEELRAGEVVPLAAELARAKDVLLRQSAVAVLVRARTPEAAAAIGTLDPENQALARSLGGGA